MKAITVKYIPPSNTKGARLKAYDMDKNQIVISYPNQSENRDAACRLAAEALRDKMGWSGELYSGATEIGEVFVFEPEIASNAVREIRLQRDALLAACNVAVAVLSQDDTGMLSSGKNGVAALQAMKDAINRCRRGAK